MSQSIPLVPLQLTAKAGWVHVLSPMCRLPSRIFAVS